jgi:hypothetical protein
MEVCIATKIVSDDSSLLDLIEMLLTVDDNAPVLESEVSASLQPAFVEFEWFDEATVASRDQGCLWIGWDCVDAFSSDYQPESIFSRFKRAGINEISIIFIYADSIQLVRSTETGGGKLPIIL